MALVIVRGNRLASLLVFAACLAAFGADAPATERPSPSEYEIKAAFLYNFTKYVVWPPESFSDAEAPLSLCVVGPDPFGPILDETVRGESAQDHPLTVRRIDKTEQAAGCHLVFVADGTGEDVRKVVRYLGSKPILTVGEIDGFAERGGIINLRKRENRVGLEINADAARRAGLRISSQLLKLGTIVASSE